MIRKANLSKMRRNQMKRILSCTWLLSDFITRFVIFFHFAYFSWMHFFACDLLKLLIIIQKGTLLEYSYPPLIEGQPHSSSALPVEWKSLPALALPDGAHHQETDSSYFLLPLPGSDRCVFGVSFYRQIETEKLKVKTADVCRETVQKYQNK